MWVKLDDGLWRNPKVTRLSAEAKALFCLTLSYGGDQLTDGVVSAGAVPMLLGAASASHAAIDELVSVGLWEPSDDGYQIHDWDQYNPSRETVLSIREARAEAGRRGGLAKAQQTESKPASKTPSNSYSKIEAKSCPVPVPDPDPVPVYDPDPSSSSSRARARGPAWDAIEARWRDLADEGAKPLTKAQLTAASTELTRAVERGDEAVFWASMQAAAEGGKPWNWFMARIRGQLNGDVQGPLPRAPTSSSHANGRTRTSDGRPLDLAGRYRDKIQRA